MGDRANIRFVYEDGDDVYFYTHWDGSKLPNILRSALERGIGRWDDEIYLARIIFSEMIQNHILNETGYGIAPYPAGDAQHPLITVFAKNKTVTIEGGRWTFAEYCSANLDNSNQL